jgi:DNA-binding transcriptional LysR family regulator
MAELQQLRDDIGRRRFGDRPVLRIGTAPSFATEVLAAPLRKFMAETSNWRISVCERTKDQLPELLLNRQADLCLMPKPKHWPAGLSARKLFQYPYAVYCRADHPLAAKRRLSLRDLLPFPLLLLNDTADTSGRLRQLAQKSAMELHVVFTSDQAATAFAMAAEGAGVAVLPRLFDHRCRRARMTQIALSDAELTATVCAVWRRDSGEPAGAEKLIAMIKSAAEVNSR